MDDTIPPAESALIPAGFRKLKKYVYPYINSVSEIEEGKYPYPEGYDTWHAPSQAGGGEGGNPSLWHPYVDIEVDLQNTGSRNGKEVVQVYVSYPDTESDDDLHIPNEPVTSNPKVDFPVRVLRAFEKVELDPGETTTVRIELTRKDLSYWSNRQQNWMMPVKGNFTFWVGTSSRNLPLSISL